MKKNTARIQTFQSSTNQAGRLRQAQELSMIGSIALFTSIPQAKQENHSEKAEQ